MTFCGICASILDFILSQLIEGIVKDSALTLKSGKTSSLEGSQDDDVLAPDSPARLSSYHCPNEGIPFRLLPVVTEMVDICRRTLQASYQLLYVAVCGTLRAKSHTLMVAIAMSEPRGAFLILFRGTEKPHATSCYCLLQSLCGGIVPDTMSLQHTFPTAVQSTAVILWIMYWDLTVLKYMAYGVGVDVTMNRYGWTIVPVDSTST
jgi:hypothetical protein